MPDSKKRVAPSDSDSEPEAAASRTATSKAKKARTSTSASVPGGGVTTAEGDVYWDISGNRRVTINEFRGRTMVSVREYYEKDGQTLPGKKGITMPLPQFAALIEALPHIESVLREKGSKLPRPAYDGAAEEMDEDEKDAGGGAKGKRNIDETSDEDN